MLIINKYTAVSVTPVVATNNNNALTGNQSTLWGGIAPNITTGATGNVAAGVGLANIVNPAVYEGEVISKLVCIKCEGALTAAADNYIRIPLDTVGITDNNRVIAGCFLGVYDPNADNTAPTPTPSLMTVQIETVGFFSIVRNAIIINIDNNSQPFYQGKIINVLLIYTGH